jgi:hypothetical protein
MQADKLKNDFVKGGQSGFVQFVSFCIPYIVNLLHMYCCNFDLLLFYLLCSNLKMLMV